MKRDELIALLERKGWTLGRRGKGSHDVYVHPRMTRPIPVPRHKKDLPEPLAKTILAQAERNVR